MVAKEEYAGGNNVTTNVKDDSKITYNGKDYPFDQPTVNVKIQFAISDAASDIFLGENLNGYADAAETKIKKVNGLNEDSKMLKDIDLSSLTLEYYSDEACTKKVTIDEIKASKPEEDKTYYVKATVKPKEKATDASNANCTLKVTENNKTVEKIYNNDANTGVYATVRKDEDGKNLAYAGQYNITVKTGKLTITKKISKNAIKESEGDPIFTFKITNETTGDVYYKTLRFSANSNDRDEEDTTTDVGIFNVKVSTTLTGLPQGIYKVEELDTMGFTLESFKVTGGTKCASKIDTDNIKIAMGLEKKEDSDWNNAKTFSSVEGDGHLDKDTAAVKATNKKTRTPGKMTDTDVVKNSFVITEEGTGTVKKDSNVDNGNTSDVRK